MKYVHAVGLFAFLIPFTCAFAETPQYAHSMGDYIKMLGNDDESAKQEAEIALSMMAAWDFDGLKKAAEGADVPGDTVERIHLILDREKPRNAARALKNKRVTATRDWNCKTSMEAYDNSGHKNPKWDADARAGILAFFNGTPDAQRLLSKAIESGCDDPLVLCCEARLVEKAGTADADTIREFYRLSLDGYTTSHYPRTFVAIAGSIYFRVTNEYWRTLLAQHKPVPDDVTGEIKRSWHWSYDIWPEVVSENPPSEMLVPIEQQIMDNFNPRVRDRSERFDPMDAELQKVIPNTSTIFLIEGEYHLRHAFDLRLVDPYDAHLYNERLTKADETLTRAFDLDPNDARTANDMLIVSFAENKGREAVEKWFSRAIAAEPDDYTAYDQMATCLGPGWYGGDADLLKFGQECYDDGNWMGGIPTMLISVRRELARQSGKEATYYRQPELWHDVQRVYEPYLRVLPNNHAWRSTYAAWACQTGHWDVANEQFDVLGANAVESQFGGKERMEANRKKAQSATNSQLAP